MNTLNMLKVFRKAHLQLVIGLYYICLTLSEQLLLILFPQC